MMWIDALFAPFQYEFMQTALWTAVLVSVVCAWLSCFLILKGWALMGDALSHSVLPGIVLASVLNLPLAFGAFCSGLGSAVTIGFLKQHSRLKEDTVMGIIFSGMFALGIVMFNAMNTGEHLTHILFGNLLGVTQSDFYQIVIVSSLVSLLLFLKRRDLLLYCFDEVQARTAGLSVGLLYYGLLVILALTIISAMQVVGVILVVAMLITPGITAYLLTKRFERMLIIAALTATLSAVAGTVISFHLDAATGPTIILLQAVIFLLIFTIQHFIIQHSRRAV